MALTPENFAEFIPSFDLSFASNEDILKNSREYLNLCNQKTTSLIKQPLSPLDIHRVRSLMIDRLIINLFHHYEDELKSDAPRGKAACTLVATGGYGREEMSLLSDIDLLLVYRDGLKEYGKPLMEKILYVLWDLKLEIGHAVRTVDECKQMMREDHTVMTALLDIRMLTGHGELYEKLRMTRDKLLADDIFKRRLIQSKISEREVRLDKFGGSVFLLEPHLKEGEGGLRDLQMMRWLARIIGVGDSFLSLRDHGYFTEVSAQCLQLALGYFLNLRNRLHLLNNTKNDQLNFEAQITIAQDLGFKDDAVSLGVEKFMQNYYAVATQNKINAKHLVQKILSKHKYAPKGYHLGVQAQQLDPVFQILDGKIAVLNEDVFQNHPRELFTLFEHVQNTGLDLHFRTRELVAQHISLVDDAFRKDPVICERFRKMMARYENLGKALFAMHEVHFFDALIPAFVKIRNRMHYDAYHVYTVDTHSIFAINELSKLDSNPDYATQFPSLKSAITDIKRPDLLSFGLLMHDIGKGEGGDHSIIGARIARSVMKGFGYSEDDTEIVEFLVLSHLMMTHLSQRRDLEDYQMINEFAKAIKSMKRLNMLYVLTWADIRAVSPEAWTEWKGTLLEKLYNKTREVIQNREKYEDVVQRKVIEVRNAILREVEDPELVQKLQGFLRSISPRYVLAHSYYEIYEHFTLLLQHEDDSLLFIDKEITEDMISEILIYTWLNPRVFPLVTGVMLSLDINILSMENFTFTDGHVFIKMRVQSRDKTSLEETGQVNALRRNLSDVFMGRTMVSTLLANRKRSPFVKKKTVQKSASEIHIDNDVSAYYTVIDVYTYDRIGLLYDMVNCLVELGCYVDVSKISTHVDKVIDSFYIKDIFGHKLTSRQKLKDIKMALLEIIDS